MDETLESEFEIELRRTVKEATEKIEEALNRAILAINEAEAISEQYGIPFYSSISPIYQGYKPNSFRKKWEIPAEDKENLDIDKLLRAEGVRLPDYEGWQHSMVC